MPEQTCLIRLPWPPKELSANSRQDRRGATDKRQKYKSDCAMMVHHHKATIAPDALLRITFHPPDNRRRDLDNMLSSIKYGLDGMADAAGVDDYGWRFQIERGQKVKGGCVLVEVVPSEVDIELRGYVM